MDEQQTRLSSSTEDYIEVIGHLCSRNGFAQVSEIAEMMGVKKPSVTVAMRRLADCGMVDYRPYSPIRLTEKGRLYADGIIRAHRVLHRFMTDVAGLSSERAGEVACRIEHLLTREEIEKIAERLPR